MTDKNKPSLRIDWFDGTVIEENRPSVSNFDDEEKEPENPSKPQYTEKKLMGFKRLYDLSQSDATTITLQLSGRSSFWDLLNSELKDDYIVLITTVLSKLYTSLRSGQKSIMLSNLLKTKFVNSNFLHVLTEYIANLPNVRTVDKRMNMQFWSDVDLFFKHVLALCSGVLDINIEATKDIKKIINVVHASVDGVISEHKEPISDEVFSEMYHLESKLEENVHQKTTVESHSNTSMVITESNSRVDINNFRNLNIFPNREDLLGKSLCDIQPSIVNGAYSLVEHYLDVQFKLLREDCFGPLRDGIFKYMENPAKTRHENIRVHPKVRIIKSYVTNNKVGHLVDIAWRERSNQTSIDSKKYAYTKQLMFGSLLLLTSDNFENILCATVLDSSLSLLNDGYLAISFQTPVSNKIFTEQYLMIESEVFFEPYHRVLKVLQTIHDDIPMRRYIVDVQKITNPPSYLNINTKYNLPQENDKEISFPALDTAVWPSEEYFGLDKSQMEAFKLALTREFAVIQGPPGTGKTFIGVKVAQTLLYNLSLEGTPMLVICYTNQALDQFLEGILPVTNKLIRLGSQSKNEKIQQYTLNNLRTKSKSKYSYLYTSKRKEQEMLFKKMMLIQTNLEKCAKEILTYSLVKPYLKIDGRNVELKESKGDPLMHWLFGHLNDETDELRESEETDELDDWEKQLDDDESNIEVTEFETCFSEEWALKEIDSMYSSIRYINDVTDDKFEKEKMKDKFTNQIEKLRKQLAYWKNRSRNFNGSGVSKIAIKTRDPHSLTTEERWNVYFNAVNVVKDRLSEDMNKLQASYSLGSQELDEIATLVDAELIKCARVVGVTTTVAARRHDLLTALKSPIVIIEEAAEVLEAHIVASLTTYCEHVILIGDHKQLRPTAAHYKLAKEYNLEISLFERMIRNGVHARTLTTQRRMRPEMVGLLVPLVYNTLESHPSVYEYESVRGVRDDMFFLSHGALEDDSIEDSWSHRNRFEAKWCIALANYLREKQYLPQDITILATYTGQASLIREMSKKHVSLRDVKITVVDNYQGEESRIVLLSLVRSNREGKIGFLSAQNRICVALSRAKEGLYIFGNMNVLKASSPIWNSMNNVLMKQNAIGDCFTLRCDVHKENTIAIRNVDAFENCLRGSCLRICEKET